MIWLLDGKKIDQIDFFDSVCWQKQLDLSFPSQLIIEFFGKNPLDTELDQHGNIVRDKFIRLDRLTIDRMQVDSDHLYHMLVLDTETGLVRTKYFGFNGRLTLDFDTPNSLVWLLREKSRSNRANKTQDSLALTVDEQHLSPGNISIPIFKF